MYVSARLSICLSVTVKKDLFRITILYTLSVDQVFMKAYTCTKQE